jgi:probable rRNA maturation factor
MTTKNSRSNQKTNNSVTLTVSNEQKRYPLSLTKLKKQWNAAITVLQKSKEWPKDLFEVNIYLVTSAKIAKVHDEFFNDPTSTDVITFPLGNTGDILACPEVANKQRKDFGTDLHTEVLTYGIHGLLHLCGYDDLNDRAYNKMKKRQDELVLRVR